MPLITLQNVKEREMEDRDYSLLRPLNIEAAKAGAEVTQYNPDCPFFATNTGKLIGGPNSIGELVFEFDDCGFVLLEKDEDELEFVKMKPLAWVDGRPVYEGDRIWCCERMAIATKDGAKYDSYDYTVSWNDFGHELWSWQPPKQKTTINMLAYFDGSALFWRTEGKPKLFDYWKRIPSEDKQIEWEE